MPNRIIRSGINASDRVDQLDYPAEVFYRRLLLEVDDHGLMDARPSILRSRLYPLRTDRLREADISRWLVACQTAGLIALYAYSARADRSRWITDAPSALREKAEPVAPHEKLYLKVLDTRWTVRSSPKYPPPPEDTCAHLRANDFNKEGPPNTSSSSYSNGSLGGSGSAEDQGGDSAPPLRAASVSQAVYDAAVAAFDRWSGRDRGRELNPAHGEHAAIGGLLASLDGQPPIIRHGEQVSQIVMVPHAVEAVMNRKNPPVFKSAAFAVGCVRNQLREWADVGIGAQPQEDRMAVIRRGIERGMSQ